MIIHEELLNQFETQSYFVYPQLLSADVISDIRDEILIQEKNGVFKKSGIGKQDNFQIDSAQRGDYIYWIDTSCPLPATGLFIEKINQLIRVINRNFYLGINDYECHYAIYPKGTHYARHIDKHHKNSDRIVSFVFYLNEDWSESDGGILRLYSTNNDFFDVLPKAGNLVVFLSDKEHEVMETARTRISITGWMLNKKIL